MVIFKRNFFRPPVGTFQKYLEPFFFFFKLTFLSGIILSFTELLTFNVLSLFFLMLVCVFSSSFIFALRKSYRRFCSGSLCCCIICMDMMQIFDLSYPLVRISPVSYTLTFGSVRVVIVPLGVTSRAYNTCFLNWVS